MLLEEEPNRQIEVLNTRTASGGWPYSYMKRYTANGKIYANSSPI